MMAAPASRSRAFFLELVLDIVIFALCAAVALQVFVEARILSDRSAALTRLSLVAQQLAEGFKATGTMPQESFYYDMDFNPCNAEQAEYEITCAKVAVAPSAAPGNQTPQAEHSEQDALRYLQITVLGHKEHNVAYDELLSIDVCYYNNNRGGAN